MKVQLKTICSIQAGVHMGSKYFVPNGDTYFVSLRDFNNTNAYEFSSPLVSSLEVKDKYFVQEGDVLFSSRGKFNAFQLPKCEKKYVASNSFLVLRPKQNIVTPAYLAWILNTTIVQSKLNFLATGSNLAIPFISAKALSDIEIELPSIEQQHKITAIDSLCKREQTLVQQIQQKKKQLTETILLNATINE